MLSRSCAEPWPQGLVVLEEKEVVTAAAGQQETGTCSFSDDLDDSLTSLQWLQEFSILGQVPQQLFSRQQQLGPDAPASPLAGDPASTGMALTPGKPTAAAYSRLSGLVARGHCPDEVDYKTNVHVKPPYSYATLICMAMQVKLCSFSHFISLYFTLFHIFHFPFLTFYSGKQEKQNHSVLHL